MGVGPNGRGGDANDRRLVGEALVADGIDVTPSDWTDGLIRGKHGQVLSTAGNIALILENEPAWQGVFALDERAARVEVFKPIPDSRKETSVPRVIGQTDVTRTAVWLERSRHGLIVTPDNAKLSNAIQMVAEARSFDRVRDYLEGVEWDGVRRIHQLLAAYFGACDTSLNSEFGSRWMISAVARALDPGVKVDHVLVLEGPQGIYKSTGVRELAGPGNFTDCMPPLGTKDASEALLGTWIVELSELDCFSRAGNSTAKAFFSRNEDRIRLPYGRRTEIYSRRVAFAATTNEDSYLRDPTGGRRYWPVSVSLVSPLKIRADRDQLWAEAAHLYRNGEPWHIEDPDLQRAAKEIQAERFPQDPWAVEIDEFLAGKESVTTAEILDYLKIPIPQRARALEMRVADALRAHDWNKAGRERRGGRRQNVYRPQSSKRKV